MRHGCALAAVLLSTMAGVAQIPTDAWPLKAPVIPPEVKVSAGLAYGPERQQVLDIYEPRSEGKRLRPAVIVIHGGGWVGGTKSWTAELVCMRFVVKGFVAANVEYRFAKHAKAPAAVTDVLAAAAWFLDRAQQYRVDAKRVVVTGDSAGGHLALMVGMTPQQAGLGREARVRAVVNFFGITDVGDLLREANERSYAVEWVPEQPGRAEAARRVSPLTHVRRRLPPILTIHGTADPSVPYSHATRLTEAVNRAGGQAVLISVAGGVHGFPRAQTDEIYQRYVWPFLHQTGVWKGELAELPPPRSGIYSCSPARSRYCR